MSETVRSVPVTLIHAGRYQPRRRFDEQKLEELTESIRQHGIIQPIVLRPAGALYEVIAGERRLRAAKRAGLGEVPAIVREYSDEAALEAALVENLQREDISVVEAARGFERLVSEFSYTHGQIAARTGKSRAAVSNILRLLYLAEPVQEMLDRGELSEGHARALLGLAEPSLQVEVGEWIVRNAVTVRETERKVRALVAGERPAPPQKTPSAPLPELTALEERLRDHFGTKVSLVYRRGRGSISLEFYSDDDLLRLFELMGVE